MSDPSAAEQFDLDLRRTVDRLTSMSLPILDHADAEGLTPADRANDLAQRLLDLASTLSSSPSMSSASSVPRLRSFASGAQLAVIGRDFRLAAQERGAEGERLLESAAALLREFRVAHL